MKRSLLIAAGVLLLGMAASAQTAPFAPLNAIDPVQLGSFTVGPTVIAKSGTKEGKAAWLVIAWRTGAGAIEYTLDVGEVGLSGDLDVLEAMSASQIFDAICSTTVPAGVASGYATCSSAGDATGVTLQSCVERSSIDFTASGTNLNRRAYAYTCTSETLTGVTGTFGCASGTEPTWVSGGGSIQ